MKGSVKIEGFLTRLLLPLTFYLVSASIPLVATAQSATTANAKPEFEVVTIKPSDPNVSRGTFFTIKGSHVIAANTDLDDLVSLAYLECDHQSPSIRAEQGRGDARQDPARRRHAPKSGRRYLCEGISRLRAGPQ